MQPRPRCCLGSGPSRSLGTRVALSQAHLDHPSQAVHLKKQKRPLTHQQGDERGSQDTKKSLLLIKESEKNSPEHTKSAVR